LKCGAGPSTSDRRHWRQIADAVKRWSDFMDRYFPEGDKTSTFSVYGYVTAQTLI
jgi:hypothetical protein